MVAYIHLQICALTAVLNYQMYVLSCLQRAITKLQQTTDGEDNVATFYRQSTADSDHSSVVSYESYKLYTM